MLGSEEILSIHLGYYQTYGKVSYSTDIAVAERPEYVLLVLGNVDDVCYLCHVSDYEYDPNPIDNKDLDKDFIQYSPERYKKELRKTWLIFDSMQKIPIDFIEWLLKNKSTSIKNFINNRANNKRI